MVHRPAPIALTMGDPAGIGPEITVDAWAHYRDDLPPFFAIADPAIYIPLMDAKNLPAPLVIQDPAQALDCFADHLPVLPLSLSEPALAGVPNCVNAPQILSSIRTAVQYCGNGQASALVTNPIAKSVLYKAGFQHAGHTEYLGELAQELFPQITPKDPVMMLCGGGLRVALATIHMALKDVPAHITRAHIEPIIRILHDALRKDFACANPRIIMCGLNPHAGENGALGKEEQDILLPLASAMRAVGIHVSDPVAADALFREDMRQNYDGVLAMYHDQGLIPVKTLDFHGGTNVTLGLPFVRVSPDHGTGFDIAGKNISRSDSLMAALRLADQIACNRMLDNG